MSKSRKLSALFAATVAASMMTGTSAFAETRHRAETQTTERSSNARSENRQRDTRAADDRTARESVATSSSFRSNDRNNGSSNSSYRNNDRNYNNNDRNYNNNNRSYRNDGARRSENFQGRVSRVERGRSGYNVWVGGARYPFFVSFDRWSRFPIRVGLSIRLGGYWNPAGYYDVYDVGSYATAGNLHGVVETVDYRRGTLVMRDDVSGSFVTVVMRGNDPRFGSLRQGDAIDLTGAWNRSGVFDAYNVADIRGGYDPRYDGRGGY